MIHPSTFLSRALLADAIFSGVSAVGLTLGAGMLAPFLNLPEALLRETGLFLIAYTALVGWLASRSSVPKALVLLVIVGNAAWTLGSFALLFSGAVSPNLLGQLVTVAQAIATGVFAELQYVGLRKSGGVVAARHQRDRRPERAHLREMRLPILDPDIEDRPQHCVGAHLGVEAMHQALDHRLVDARPLHDFGRQPLTPLRPCHDRFHFFGYPYACP